MESNVCSINYGPHLPQCLIVGLKFSAPGAPKHSNKLDLTQTVLVLSDKNSGLYQHSSNPDEPCEGITIRMQ
jgi:hypothetical protein